MEIAKYFLTQLIKLLIMPLGCAIVLLGLGLIFYRRPFSPAFLVMGVGILYLFSIPATSFWFSHYLETFPAITFPVQTDAEVIVVLGSGAYIQAPEYGADSLKKRALERVRYAAWLYRETGLPILTSGGKNKEQTLSEAVIAKKILENEFAARVKWVEPNSSNTQENAQFSCQILKQAEIKKILLVTHAWHMPRSMVMFSQYCTDITIQAAPTLFKTKSAMDRGAFILMPDVKTLQKNTTYWHEFVGLFWYKVTRNK